MPGPHCPWVITCVCVIRPHLPCPASDPSEPWLRLRRQAWLQSQAFQDNTLQEAGGWRWQALAMSGQHCPMAWHSNASQLASPCPQGEILLACPVTSTAAQSRDTSELSLLDRCGTVCASLLAPGRLPLATSCLDCIGRCHEMVYWVDNVGNSMVMESVPRIIGFLVRSNNL